MVVTADSSTGKVLAKGKDMRDALSFQVLFRYCHRI